MVCCAARSAFGRRAEPERSEGDGARLSVAVPNGEGVASGSATQVLNETCNKKPKKEKSSFKKIVMLKQAKNLCCAARGHALAVWPNLVPRRPNSLRPAQRPCFIIAKNLKKLFLSPKPLRT